MDKCIEIKGARVNNLKNISLKIPRNKFVVITGVSGSGKSSLAFDTLYAEGQRRYVESLSSYARQYLGRMHKPECDFIVGLPPAIAIEQKVISRNPRSTVGTMTEIYQYMCMLFTRIGHTISPLSGEEVAMHTSQDVVDKISQFSEGSKFLILSPLHVAEGRTLQKQLSVELQQGYSRVWFGNEIRRIDDILEDCQASESTKSDEIYLVIDRINASNDPETISRVTDSVETAFFEGNGKCRVVLLPAGIKYDFSSEYEADGIAFEKPNDNMFLFNSPSGACPECEGFGMVVGIDEKLVIPNTSLSVYDGCVQCWHGDKLSVWKTEFCRRAAKDNFPIFEPYYKLTPKQKEMLWHGLPSERKLSIENQVSIDAFFKMVKDNQYKIQYRVLMSRYRGKTICPSCRGKRLKEESSWVKIAGKSITDLIEVPVSNLIEWFDNLNITPQETQIADRLLKEITSRLHFLDEVGLGYLSLNRAAMTLSGGESQRINLTKSLGSSLVGSLYILDEPSIGLHSKDTRRLIDVLRKLQRIGNTVVVVEHDEEIMRAADYLIDIGPDAGVNGGEVVFEGMVDEIDRIDAEKSRSHTVKYLTGKEQIELPHGYRQWNKAITIKGARMNNLKGIDVQFPLNVLTVVTGVSGSGKSSLVTGILFPALKRHLNEVADAPGEYSEIEGDWNQVSHVEYVDQNPIGKSTRSNPATYVKAYDAIRRLYSEQPLAKQEGFSAQHFSFNAEGGRCEECKGAGTITVEMQFMSDIILECDACHGKRFKKDILDVRFHEKNINDVLEMTVSEAVAFFSEYGEKAIVKRLKPLEQVGLGYIKLGQSSSTLSGGENQRVKLAYFIGQERQDPTLFIFDEPTTGLHFHDIQCLLKAFNSLIEKGHSVIVIEHNMDVIKCADYIIDLGKDGGNEGGNVVCTGTPPEIAACKDSYTGLYLKEKMQR